MTLVKGIIVFILTLSFISCGNDLNLGMKYQKKVIIAKDNSQIYCYSLSWALDAQAFYISTNKEVCLGFDSTKDFCFRGPTNIYYKNGNNDTLEFYITNKTNVPINSSINAKIIKLDGLEVMKYEDRFRKSQINKVVFGTILLNIPCNIVPYSTANNMKFKGK